MPLKDKAPNPSQVKDTPDLFLRLWWKAYVEEKLELTFQTTQEAKAHRLSLYQARLPYTKRAENYSRRLANPSLARMADELSLYIEGCKITLTKANQSPRNTRLLGMIKDLPDLPPADGYIIKREPVVNQPFPVTPGALDPVEELLNRSKQILDTQVKPAETAKEHPDHLKKSPFVKRTT